MEIKELTDEQFEKYKNPSFSIKEEEEKFKNNLYDAYMNIIDLLKEYLDLKEEYYNIIALWIVGTYFHEYFPSYPFLFLNAQKGSGKSRAMNLIINLAKDGDMLNAMTEAVLFRTSGTLGIDEFEGVNRKGNENMRELLNSAYKQGIKIKRMKQIKTKEGSEHVVEEFDPYRPIVLANIWGMENVLGDRCITLVLEKSNKRKITNLIEIFKHDEKLIKTKKLLEDSSEKCRLCRCRFSVEAYKKWNKYIIFSEKNNTNNTNNTHNINDTNERELFKTIDSMDLNGREIELTLPLCLVASEISSVVLRKTTLTFKELFKEKREEELVDDMDTSLIDFVSQETETGFISINEIVRRFKEFLASDDAWINSKWMGRALKRLGLYREKRRMGRGRSVILDIEKAKRKIKMYK